MLSRPKEAFDIVVFLGGLIALGLGVNAYLLPMLGTWK
jgi:hypothetical protein